MRSAVIVRLFGVCAIGLLMVTMTPVATAGDPPGASYTTELRLDLQKALAGHGPDYQPRTKHLTDNGTPVYINRLILEDSPYLRSMT